jgi:hypothetical protein
LGEKTEGSAIGMPFPIISLYTGWSMGITFTSLFYPHYSIADQPIRPWPTSLLDSVLNIHFLKNRDKKYVWNRSDFFLVLDLFIIGVPYSPNI